MALERGKYNLSLKDEKSLEGIDWLPLSDVKIVGKSIKLNYVEAGLDELSQDALDLRRELISALGGESADVQAQNTPDRIILYSICGRKKTSVFTL